MVKWIWEYDENGVLIKGIEYQFELDENGQIIEPNFKYTAVPISVGYVKPTFNKLTQEWYEGATEEEIKAWEEDNRPPEDKTIILEKRVLELENMTAGLLLSNAEQQIKIQEHEVAKNEQEITNANLLLEIAKLKGVI